MSHYLAVDFGGTRTRAGWFDESLNLLGRYETPSNVQDPVETVIQRLIDTARAVIPAGQQPSAIGISAPGPLDAERGIIHHAKTLPEWEAVPLAKHISEAFESVPTVMQNDANLAALAEYHVGAGQGCDPLIYLTISTGIGGGAVIDGRLFTGWRGLAIEPGHVRLMTPDGSIRRLEELASGTALGVIARQRLRQDHTDSSLRQVESVDGKAVGAAARQGDPLALEIVQEAGRYLGFGLVALLHLFNPQAIVIGGSVTLLGDLFFDPAKEVIRANLLDAGFYDDNLIRLAALGDDVCLHGAAHYARSCHER
jgi:glucokinase